MPRPFRPDPLAFFITFSCYGSWFHGSEKGSHDPWHNERGQPEIEPNPTREAWERSKMTHAAFTLNATRRGVVARTLQEVCDHRRWVLLAGHVRTNHVHVVVSGEAAPERMMDTFKQYSTRRMREAGVCNATDKPWSRHGSTVHLWDETKMGDAIAYVLCGQGPDLAGDVSLPRESVRANCRVTGRC